MEAPVKVSTTIDNSQASELTQKCHLNPICVVAVFGPVKCSKAPPALVSSLFYFSFRITVTLPCLPVKHSFCCEEYKLMSPLTCLLSQSELLSIEHFWWLDLESLDFDWAIGGWRRLGVQSYWAGKLRRVGKNLFGIRIRGNAVKSGGTTRRVSSVWDKLNKRCVHF